MSNGSIWSKLESMGVLKNDQKIVFFLNLGGKLPPFYIQLAQELSYRDINLIPIKMDQISLFLKQKSFMRIICSVTNLTELELFRPLNTSILNHLIRQKRVSLFHFSSFDFPLTISSSVHKNNYQFIMLPEKFSEICNMIESSFYLNGQETEVWPGGGKAALPKFEKIEK